MPLFASTFAVVLGSACDLAQPHAEQCEGEQCECSQDECAAEDDESSDDDAAPECTAQSEIERWRDKFGDGVPIPAECYQDTLVGTYQGEVPPYDSGYDAPGRNTVSARFDGPSLVELDGVPCEAVSPGEASDSMAYGSDESECEQPFVCGCCVVTMKRRPLGDGDGGVQQDVWELEPQFPGCTLDLKGTGYLFGFDRPANPTPTPDPDPSSGCDECLSSCEGLSSCCTGSGCLCQYECAPTECIEGLTYCCGPDGFCFCTDSCPY